MERCDYKSLKQEYRYRNTTREHPSFSSTLLDSIYRSIDENNNNNNNGETTEQELIFYRETMRKKQINSNNNQTNSSKEEDLANLKRACLIEKWMEKKKSNSTEKVVVVRRKSMADFHRSSNSMMLNSSSSSNSDSSFSGGLSSSEAESIYGVNSRPSNFNTIQKPKPIRTSVSSEKYHHNNKSNGHEESYNREVEKVQWHKINHHHESSNSSNSNNNFVKTKSRALKIYSELKKVRQPISPGGRVASFLNSLFAHGDSKKAKISTTQHHHRDTIISEKTKSKSAYSSTCSSASSFSRSCLSKTPSSSSRGGKVINGGGAKRSVRFYPVDVIVDHEDCRPVGHKSSLHEDDQFGVKNVRNVDENARNVVMNNYERNTGDLDMKDVDEASDDDDDASCASSDLFELDNLATIGIDRYSEELPVYETTHFGMNRAIAKGLIV